TTVFPAVARRWPATSTPPANLKARIVVDSVGTKVELPAAALDSGTFCNSPLRRKSAGKSSLPPEKFWSSATGGLSIIHPCAGGSASIDSDRLSASFSADPLCPAGTRPASADHHHRPALDPTERDQMASALAPA